MSSGPVSVLRRRALALAGASLALAHVRAAADERQRTLHLADYRIEPLRPEPGPARLLDAEDRPLGPVIGEYDFCGLAAAGAGVIDRATYRVIGTGRRGEADCRTWFRRLARKQPVAAGNLSRSRFVRIDWPWGLGAGDYRLVPWRTVAADPLHDRLGTVLLVAELRGLPLPDGTRHDGYVFVGDRREGATGDRVGLFVGRTDEPGAGFAPDPAAPRTVTVTTVDDPVIVERLATLHRMR
jgi:hypothetical protein